MYSTDLTEIIIIIIFFIFFICLFAFLIYLRRKMIIKSAINAVNLNDKILLRNHRSSNPLYLLGILPFGVIGIIAVIAWWSPTKRAQAMYLDEINKRNIKL